MTSLQTLPYLFFNLGGEMVFILMQRLEAQKIPADKANKILKQTIRTMFQPAFVDELWKPQAIYSQSSVRSIFDKIINSSMIKLNATSSDKLYDLMLMGFKYQLKCVSHPRELLLLTLNHLDAIRVSVSQHPQEVAKVEQAMETLVKKFHAVSLGAQITLRTNLLSFFEGKHTKVSVFLSKRIQHPNGHFAVADQMRHSGSNTDTPGSIRYYDAQKLSRTGKFNASQDVNKWYPLKEADASVGLQGSRGTELGKNLYIDDPEKPLPKTPASDKDDSDINSLRSGRALQELNDLSAALIGKSLSDGSEKYTIQLFADETSEPEGSIGEIDQRDQQVQIIEVDARKRPGAHLLDMLSRLDNCEANGSSNDAGGDDLLSLMDQAANK